MSRKSELENFFRKNRDLLENCKNRLFIDLYATGSFTLDILSPALVSSKLPRQVLDQILVMQRREDILKKNSTLSKFVCLLPLIDINSESQQISSLELRTLLTQSNKDKSISVFPHSYYNYLSSDFLESELFCLQNRIYTDSKTHALSFTTNHMKYLKKIYGFNSMPYIVDEEKAKNKNKIKIIELKNARDTIFRSIYYTSAQYGYEYYLEQRRKTGKFDDLESELAQSFDLQKYRILREIGHVKDVRVLDLITEKKSVNLTNREGSDFELFYEVPFCNFYSLNTSQKKEEYKKLKYDAYEYVRKNNSIQLSLF